MSAVYGFYRGRWDDTLADLAAAAELPLDETQRRFLGGPLAQVALHRNDQAAMATYLGGAEEVAFSGPRGPEILVELLRVAWALAAERDANPAEALTRLLSIFDPQGSLEFTRLGTVSTLWLPDVVRLALAVGETAVAMAAADAGAREAEHQARLPPRQLRCIAGVSLKPIRPPYSPLPTRSTGSDIRCSKRRRWRTQRSCMPKREMPTRHAPRTWRRSESTTGWPPPGT